VLSKIKGFLLNFNPLEIIGFMAPLSKLKKKAQKVQPIPRNLIPQKEKRQRGKVKCFPFTLEEPQRNVL